MFITESAVQMPDLIQTVQSGELVSLRGCWWRREGRGCREWVRAFGDAGVPEVRMGFDVPAMGGKKMARKARKQSLEHIVGC